jgi:hypothetical protein
MALDIESLGQLPDDVLLRVASVRHKVEGSRANVSISGEFH